MPFWRPDPLTSLIDSEGKPSAEQLHPDRLERLVADERLDLLHAVTSFVVGMGEPALVFAGLGTAP